MPRGGRECKRVEIGQARRGVARRGDAACAASLGRLCNTFMVELYTHRRDDVRRGGKKHDPDSSRASDTR